MRRPLASLAHSWRLLPICPGHWVRLKRPLPICPGHWMRLRRLLPICPGLPAIQLPLSGAPRRYNWPPVAPPAAVAAAAEAESRPQECGKRAVLLE